MINLFKFVTSIAVAGILTIFAVLIALSCAPPPVFEQGETPARIHPTEGQGYDAVAYLDGKKLVIIGETHLSPAFEITHVKDMLRDSLGNLYQVEFTDNWVVIKNKPYVYLIQRNHRLW